MADGCPVADLHTKVSGAHPPTGPNSFIFTYVFTEKCLCQRLVPPPTRVGTPPMGNPGSAPAACYIRLPAFQSAVPHFPSSLDGIRNRKALNGSRLSECSNQTPPSKSDTALFSCGQASANQRLSHH